jgi:hypothetical protein
MSRANPVEYLIHGDWLDTILPDFVLSFVFFTALIYAVLGRRMGHQRPAVAASAALGAALAAGLVTWEQYNDLSIRHLGPIAAGFGLIIGRCDLSIHPRHRRLMGRCRNRDRRLSTRRVDDRYRLAGAAGDRANRHGRHPHGWRAWRSCFIDVVRCAGAPHAPAGFIESRRDMTDITEDRSVSDRVVSGLHHLRANAADLWQRPGRADDIMLQLKRILPAEGWLTQRMARLRTRALQVKRGHVARIEVLRDHTKGLPTKAKIRSRANCRAGSRSSSWTIASSASTSWSQATSAPSAT